MQLTNKFIAILSVLMLFFCACGGDSSEQAGKGNNSALRPADGGVNYGGIFKMNETDYFRSLYPLNVTEVGGNRITNQIYEGLVRFDQKDLSIKPCLAESWEINEAGTIYTFKIRSDVYYHNDDCFPEGKGRLMTVEDVKWNFDRLFEADDNNQGYTFFKDRVLGAKEYYAASKTSSKPAGGVKGVRIVEGNKIQIELVRPFGGLLNLLALPFGYVFPKEAVEKYGVEMRIKTVGTGPFYLKAVKENDRVILIRNEKYWDKDEHGNQLPYLDGIKWTFIADQKSELYAFKQDRLDMMYRLPSEMLDEIIDRAGNLKEGYTQFQFQEAPSMSVQYYGFKMSEGRFAENKKLRQAFNYAIDRDKIVTYTVKGAGIPANGGMVPPCFLEYDVKKIKGYKFDAAKAKKLLAEAGYPNGEGLDDLTLQLNSGGTRNEQIAEAIQKMLKENLNVDINITKMPFPQHLELVETSKTEFWRAGWVADYPDPENFINLFNSRHIPEKLSDKSYTNTFRWRNAEFDELYYQAEATIDLKERNALYMKADQIMIDDAPVIPIYYYKDRRLLQPTVQNFPQNAMEYRNLRDVYFK